MILASLSPRRRELLSIIANEFTVVPSEADESFPDGTPPQEAVMMLALRKAKHVARIHPGRLVVGADTVVVLSGEILGKPTDETDAFKMLSSLSGKTHTVYTGVAIARDDKSTSFYEATEVTFRVLSSGEIRSYIQTGEPMDKAGAYGIQEKGALFVSGIRGDYFNVVGLPLCALHQKIIDFDRDKIKLEI